MLDSQSILQSVPDAPLWKQTAPQAGARWVFFSGGSALKAFSMRLKHYTHNSVHLLTPFDSGGSSAVLRRAFNMPAVGDIRSRLLALADEHLSGNTEIYQLANYRLPHHYSQTELKRTLARIGVGQHPLTQAIPSHVFTPICQALDVFQQHMPPSFDLRGASIGNLILAGGYLYHARQLAPVIDWVANLLQVRGQACLVTEAPLHLVAKLASNRLIIGQHLFTGKEVPPLAEPIRELSLSAHAERNEPADVAINAAVVKHLQQADLICYPPGSFYSSLIANLLPCGVSHAIAKSTAPKVYLPNLGYDPEQGGMRIMESVAILMTYLQRNYRDKCDIPLLLSHVLIDEHYHAISTTERQYLADLGITVCAHPLVSEQSKPYYDNDRVIQALATLSM